MVCVMYQDLLSVLVIKGYEVESSCLPGRLLYNNKYLNLTKQPHANTQDRIERAWECDGRALEKANLLAFNFHEH